MRITLCFVGLSLLLTACTDFTYTWGTTTDQIGQIYCGGSMQCGFLAEEDLDVCIEHAAWHLCAPDGTCGVELNQTTTEEALTACDAAVRTLDEEGCYLLGVWGFMPPECDAIWELQPDAR